MNRPNLNRDTTEEKKREECRKRTLDRTKRNCLPNEIASKRKLVLAARQLAINAALESLFGHEINSELASIIRGRISRWSSTRRVEKGKKKKRFNDASFRMLFFRPLQRATNEQAHVSVKLGRSITPTTKLGSRLLPALEASFEDFWRPRRRTPFVRFLSEKIIRA